MKIRISVELKSNDLFNVVALAHFVIEEEGAPEVHLYPLRVLKGDDGRERVAPNIEKGQTFPSIVFTGEAEKRVSDYILNETKRLLKKVN